MKVPVLTVPEVRLGNQFSTAILRTSHLFMKMANQIIDDSFVVPQLALYTGLGLGIHRIAVSGGGFGNLGYSKLQFRRNSWQTSKKKAEYQSELSD